MHAFHITSVMSDSLDPMDYSLTGSSVHGIFQARILEWGCHFLPQWIFPTRGSNPGLPHCRHSLHCLSHQGSPILHKSHLILRLCEGRSPSPHHHHLQRRPPQMGVLATVTRPGPEPAFSPGWWDSDACSLHPSLFCALELWQLTF